MVDRVTFGPSESWKMGSRRKRCHIPVLLDGEPVGEIFGIQNTGLSHDVSYHVDVLGNNLGRFYDLEKAKESARDAIAQERAL